MNRSIPLAVACAVVVLVAVWPGAVPASDAKDSDALFSKKEVLKLSVELVKAEADALRRDPRKYAKATLKAGDKTYTDVGVHLKGAAGSFRGLDDKPGLTLNMDKFHDDQRFHGLDKFHLANSVQDPSYLSELVCGELYRAAGVPAARVAHAVVTVNGRGRGLYLIREGYDTGFLKRYFKTARGNFYDGGFLRDIDQPLELKSSKGDVADHKDLKALFAAANERDHAKRLAALEKLLEFDRFLVYMAYSAVFWDWDGYPFKANNYRVYHNPDTGKITFIPSGMDQMFGDPNGPAVPDFQGQVARRIMETKDGRARYIAKLTELMKGFDPVALGKRLDELEKVVQPALAVVDAGAGRDYKNQVNRLRTAMVQRKKSIDEQLAKMKKEKK